MSHAAVLSTCQMPDRSGLPSAVRGTAADCPCAASPAAAVAISSEVLSHFFMRIGSERRHDTTPQLARTLPDRSAVKFIRSPADRVEAQLREARRCCDR